MRDVIADVRHVGDLSRSWQTDESHSHSDVFGLAQRRTEVGGVDQAVYDGRQAVDSSYPDRVGRDRSVPNSAEYKQANEACQYCS